MSNTFHENHLMIQTDNNDCPVRQSEIQKDEISPSLKADQSPMAMPALRPQLQQRFPCSKEVFYPKHQPDEPQLKNERFHHFTNYMNYIYLFGPFPKVQDSFPKIIWVLVLPCSTSSKNYNGALLHA